MSQIVKLTGNMSVAIRDADSKEEKSIPIAVKALKLETESQGYRPVGTFVDKKSSILFYLSGVDSASQYDTVRWVY